MELFNVSNDCMPFTLYTVCTHRSQSRPIHFVTKGIPIPLHFYKHAQATSDGHTVYMNNQRIQTRENTIYFSLFFRLVLLFPYFPFIISIRFCSVRSSHTPLHTIQTLCYTQYHPLCYTQYRHTQTHIHTHIHTHPIASFAACLLREGAKATWNKKGALVATAAATRKFMARMTEKKIFILSTIATAKRQNCSTIFQDENAFNVGGKNGE